MKISRKLLLAILGTYVVACAALGFATTELFNHHLYWGSRVDPDPKRARAWDLVVSETAVTFPEVSDSETVLSKGWIEHGNPRRATFPYLPFPDLFLLNRYSLRLDRPEPFGVLHFRVLVRNAEARKIHFIDVPVDRWKGQSCFRPALQENSPTADFGCDIAIFGPTQGKFHGYLTTEEGRKIERSEFAVHVAWPPIER